MNEEFTELVIRLLIVCAAVTWLVILWRLHQSPAMPNFSFRNIISTRDGFPDRAAIMEFGSWLGLTGALIVLTLRDELTEWFCGIYVGATLLRGAHSAWLHAANPPHPGKITTTQESSTQTRTVESPPKPGQFT